MTAKRCLDGRGSSLFAVHNYLLLTSAFLSMASPQLRTLSLEEARGALAEGLAVFELPENKARMEAAIADGMHRLCRSGSLFAVFIRLFLVSAAVGDPSKLMAVRMHYAFAF